MAKKDDLDLTPPEEIRARRIKLLVFLGAVVACVLGVAFYFAAPPVGGAIKGWQSRRLSRQAFALIEQGKWSEANSKARDAYLLRPTEAEPWRAIARLAFRTSQWAPALEWWKKVDDADRLTVEDRRDYIAAALATGEVTSAAKQVQFLMSQRALSAIDLVWAGQVASRQSDPVVALDYAQSALQDKRAKPYEILAAATLVLSVTSPDSQPYASAWKQIEDVARDPKNPGSLGALVFLANEQAVPPMPAIGGNTSLSLESSGRRSLGKDGTPAPSPSSANQGAAVSSLPPVSPDSTPQPTPATQSGDTVALNLAATARSSPAGQTMSLAEVADALENHPDARPYHKLLALEVRTRQDPILIDQFVADAIQRFGNGDDETLAALAAWLNKIGRPAKTLEVLPETHAVQRQDLFLPYLDALGALQRWNTVKEVLSSERFPIAPVLQHMYLAVAQTHLGSASGATNEWQRALEVANTSEKASALASYAEQNSANDIADAAYSVAIKIVPRNRQAYAGRLHLALAAGETAQAQTIAAQISQVWPEDANARIQDVYLQLLLGASPDVAKAAERDAQLLVAKEPRNWSARATLGLARLRLSRPNEALAAIREPRVTGAEPPGALAVRAAILAANGYGDGARNDARLVSAKRLLPEERTLIALLLVERRE
jgi:tetratricopeptide (TPR) repeat protein